MDIALAHVGNRKHQYVLVIHTTANDQPLTYPEFHAGLSRAGSEVERDNYGRECGDGTRNLANGCNDGPK
jgi:hypothetical protein